MDARNEPSAAVRTRPPGGSSGEGVIQLVPLVHTSIATSPTGRPLASMTRPSIRPGGFRSTAYSAGAIPLSVSRSVSGSSWAPRPSIPIRTAMISSRGEKSAKTASPSAPVVVANRLARSSGSL